MKIILWHSKITWLSINATDIAALVAVMIVIIVLLFIFIRFFLPEIKIIFNHYFRKRKLSIHETEEIKKILARNGYYNNLSQDGKEKFLKRTLTFMFSTDFIGAGNFKVDDSIRVFISGAVVQLTFGLDEFNLESIIRIIIHEKEFKNKRTGIAYKGLTTGNGIMALSWKDVIAGYSEYSDGINLALHETAHALYVLLDADRKIDKRFMSYFDEWEKIASQEFQDISNGKTGFLRNYAKTNKAEFFAVCVEHFFEQPALFEKNLPDIYNHLCFLLNQNPLENEKDYILLPERIAMINSSSATTNPVPEKLKISYARRSWHWSFTASVINALLFLVIFLLTYNKFMLGGTGYFFIWATCGIVCFFSFRNFYISHNIIEASYFPLVSFIGLPAIF